jgi:Ca2+/Na+ antiporter
MPIAKKRAFLSWLWVVLCSIAIFLTVPVARRIQIFVSNHWGRILFMYFVLVVLTVSVVVLLYFLIIKKKVGSPANYIWLFILSGLYAYFTVKLKHVPEQAVHFLEYGLLSFFLFKALSHHIRDRSIYITATFLALLVGTFDEILQWITPGRYWDFRDVGLNVLSGGLFQLIIWKVIKPKIISGKFSYNSLKIFSFGFAACLTLLGLCVLNTPNRVYNYTKHIKCLSYLQREEPMSEFGYKYRDPEIGIFYSRLSLSRLNKIEKQKGEEYAQILNECFNRDYEQFIKEYSPITNPFVHELRVHVFRRDTYFKKARVSSEIGEKKESYLIAYKENLILQKYFTQSIKKSVYSWEENKVKEAKILIDRNKPYVSPVSANLFTLFSEKTVWISIIMLLSFLVIINLIFPYIKKERIINY